MTCHDCGSDIEPGDHCTVHLGVTVWEIGTPEPVTESTTAVICVPCLEIQERPNWRKFW